MSAIPQKLTAFLDAQHVAYEILHHRLDYTAQETAAHTHTPGRAFAKTVLLWIDGAYAMAAIPAHHKVDLRRLGQALGAKEVKLATEEEMAAVCPDCEPGALPPFGNLYNVPVYMSTALSGHEEITFHAGSHTDAIRMRQSDFERLIRPRVMAFSQYQEG